MPIVVDEVVISVEVAKESRGGTSAPAPAPSSSEEKQAIISECVERVLEILRQREER